MIGGGRGRGESARGDHQANSPSELIGCGAAVHRTALTESSKLPATMQLHLSARTDVTDTDRQCIIIHKCIEWSAYFVIIIIYISFASETRRVSSLLPEYIVFFLLSVRPVIITSRLLIANAS